MLAAQNPDGGVRARTNALWEIRGPQFAWVDDIIQALRNWIPHPDLKLDVAALHTAVAQAAAQKAAWTYHPALLAFQHRIGDTLRRDFQAAFWIAANTSIDFTINVPRRLFAWTPECPRHFEPGQICSAEVKTSFRAPPRREIPLDVWSLLTPDIHGSTWAAKSNLSKEEEDRLRVEITRYLAALDFLNNRLGACAAWVSHATRTVVPNVRQSDGRMRSSSQPDLQGIVFIDLGTRLELLEALVHESAHQHFFLMQRRAALVDPAHTETYFSPLRKGPRPLRGIFLAYHALVYIDLFYSEALVCSPLAEPELETTIRNDIRRSLEVTSMSMEQGKAHLTKAGLDLYHRLRDANSSRTN